MRARAKPAPIDTSLPALRLEIPETARILRMSRAQVYIRIQQGALRAQKDGGRTYVTHRELERYVEACDAPSGAPTRQLSARGRTRGMAQ